MSMLHNNLAEELEDVNLDVLVGMLLKLLVLMIIFGQLN